MSMRFEKYLKQTLSIGDQVFSARGLAQLDLPLPVVSISTLSTA